MEQPINDPGFQDYLVQRALPMMLENNDWRIFLINNAIDFIGVHNLNTVHQDYVNHMTHIANNAFGDDTPMNIGELLLENTESPLTDNEDSPHLPIPGGKKRTRTRKTRKRRKSRQ